MIAAHLGDQEGEKGANMAFTVSRRHPRAGSTLAAVLAAAILSGWGGAALAAVDPGLRGGAPAAGGPLPGLTAAEQQFFAAGLADFVQVSSVQGEAVIPNTERGLGPRFNLDSCGGCHAQPATGGTSPHVNPQVAVATLQGAHNAVPWFVAANGPVREARFKRNPDGSRDGGVTDLFVISGRADAPGCNIAQPGFGAPGNPLTGQGGNPNLIFRIPTPAFGAGLIEAIPDGTLVANKNASAIAKLLLGISGHENRNGNDGTITRFGWKAQNKSLLLFSAEAYNVEQGITNEIFGNEREENAACTALNPLTEDASAFDPDPAEAHSSIVKFATFMRLLAPPTPAPTTPSTAAGRATFGAIGCALCHTPSLTTGKMASAALSQKPVNLFSDLLLHDMGAGLADDIQQGAASGREFRTAPLWGLGQRIFFLHDGRTSDLVAAIEAHAGAGSEANGVIQLFNGLADRDKQNLLNFLRSL
jgi:CxxC motif-containing protein (DUF1111 family)